MCINFINRSGLKRCASTSLAGYVRFDVGRYDTLLRVMVLCRVSILGKAWWTTVPVRCTVSLAFNGTCVCLGVFVCLFIFSF